MKFFIFGSYCFKAFCLILGRSNSLSVACLHRVTSCIISDRDSYPILKRPGVNALRSTFETDINPIAQTTSGGCLGHIPDETGQV